MIDWIIQLFFCSHNYRLVPGQKVYMTEDSYKLKCTKCGRVITRSYMMFIGLEEELNHTGQEIQNGYIVDHYIENNPEQTYDPKTGTSHEKELPQFLSEEEFQI